jgi:predicted MFS family arabinose efflux permease
VTSSGDAPSETRRVPATLLPVLTATTFVVAGAGTAISPFLQDIARDLGTDLGAIGNLFAVLSITWGLLSLTAGAASDRVGRRPILAAATLTMAASRLGMATAASYPAAVVWHLVTGVGGGAFTGTVLATVSDHVAPAQRGRALGWVVTGQSLALVFGTPLLTLVGTVGGWRGAMVTQGLAAMLMAGAIWVVVPRHGHPRATPGTPAPPLHRLLVPRVLLLLGAGLMERACFVAAAVYLATFLLTAYGISLAQVALALALVALGNLAGNIVGGQIADRVPNRPLVSAGALAVTGLLGLPLLAWQPGVAVSVLLGFTYSLVNAVARPPLLAALAEVSSEARGAILGLNITTGSIGWIGAAGLGGWLLGRAGFGALGVFCVVTGLLGAAMAALAARRRLPTDAFPPR